MPKLRQFCLLSTQWNSIFLSGKVFWYTTNTDFNLSTVSIFFLNYLEICFFDLSFNWLKVKIFKDHGIYCNIKDDYRIAWQFTSQENDHKKERCVHQEFAECVSLKDKLKKGMYVHGYSKVPILTIKEAILSSVYRLFWKTDDRMNSGQKGLISGYMENITQFKAQEKENEQSKRERKVEIFSLH